MTPYHSRGTYGGMVKMGKMDNTNNGGFNHPSFMFTKRMNNT